MAKINGTSILLYSGANLIAASKNHTLNLESDTMDVTTKDSAGWKEILPALKSWSIDCDGLVSFSDTYNLEYFVDAIANRTLLSVKLQTGTAGNERFLGDVYVTSASLEAPMEDATSFSVSMEGTGALSHETET